MLKIIKLICAMMSIVIVSSCSQPAEQDAAAPEKTHKKISLDKKSVAAEFKYKDIPYEKEILISAKTGGGPGQIGIFPGGDEAKERHPQAFDVLNNGAVLIVDNENDRVLEFDSSGKFSSVTVNEGARNWFDISADDRSAVFAYDVARNAVIRFDIKKKSQKEYKLPPRLSSFSRFVKDENGIAVKALERNYRLTDISKPQTNLLENAKFTLMPGTPLLKTGNYIKTKKVSTGLGNYGVVEISASADGKSAVRSFDVRLSEEEGKFGSFAFMGSDTLSRMYFRIEMVTSFNPVRVKRFIARFNSDGENSGIIEIPSDGMGAPATDIRITKDGAIFLMIPYADRLEIIKWKFSE